MKTGRSGLIQTINNEKEWWELSYRNIPDGEYWRVPMYALSNEKYDILDWLENEKNVDIHKTRYETYCINNRPNENKNKVEWARESIDKYNNYWGNIEQNKKCNMFHIEWDCKPKPHYKK